MSAEDLELLRDLVKRYGHGVVRAQLKELAPGAPGRPGTPREIALETAYAKLEARIRVYGESASEAARRALDVGGIVYQGAASRLKKVQQTNSATTLRNRHAAAKKAIAEDPVFAAACEWRLELELAAEEARRDGRDVSEAVLRAAGLE